MYSWDAGRLRNPLAYLRPVLAVDALYIGLDIEVCFVTPRSVRGTTSGERLAPIQSRRTVW